MLTVSPDGRFYVQYQPDADGFERLTKLRDGLAKYGGRPVPDRQIHLSVIHFGIYARALDELRAYAPDVDETVFRRELGVWLNACAAMMPPTGAMIPAGFARFGTHASVLVVEGRADLGLERLHAGCLTALQSMLARVLGRDPGDFMCRSPNFRHALTFRPHIALRTSIAGTEEVRRGMPGKSGTPIRLDAMPLADSEGHKHN